MLLLKAPLAGLHDMPPEVRLDPRRRVGLALDVLSRTAAARGLDVADLKRRGAAGDKAGVSAALKAAGYKMGERLKVEAALFPAE